MQYSSRKFVVITLLLCVVFSVMALGRYRSSGLVTAAALQNHPMPSVSSNLPFIVSNANLIPNGGPNLQDFDDFSWQSFIALNWPAKLFDANGKPLRGVPDTTKTLGDPGPRVWETWKADFELFQPGGVPPSDWESFQVVNPCPNPTPAPALRRGAKRGAPQAALPGKILPLIAKGDSVLPGGVNQAMGGPLTAQQKINNKLLTYVRYEIRVNQTQYNETKNGKWYLRSGLPNYPKPAISFTSSTLNTATGQGTYGAIELKAAWRLMTPAEMSNPTITSRYYITQATVVDPNTGTCSTTTVPVGLVGFHIGHKSSPFTAWVWSTFEHVDNVPCTAGEVGGGDSRCAKPVLSEASPTPNPMPAPTPPGGYSFNNGQFDQFAARNGFSPASAAFPFNPKKPPFKPVQTIRFNELRNDIISMNNFVMTLPGVQGTPWQFYKLVANQWSTNNIDPNTGKSIPIVVNDPTGSADLYPQGSGNPFPQDSVANITMETYYQVQSAAPFKNFGTSCIHCHYQAAQTDFSWVTADMAFPRNPGTSNMQ
jgi:hypothetical protein